MPLQRTMVPRYCGRRFDSAGAHGAHTGRDNENGSNTMAGYEYWDACGDGITEDKARAAYDEMLDHVHGEFMGITAAEILSECDPIAYRVGFHDFVDLMLADGEWFEQDPTADDDDSEDDD